MSATNIAASANVMVERHPNRSSDLTDAERIAALPGDFAVQVYRSFWPNKEVIRKRLTPAQLIEYEQYLVCGRCGRTCAGTCER